MKVYVVLETYDLMHTLDQYSVATRVSGVFVSKTQAEREAGVVRSPTIGKQVVEKELQYWGED